MTVLCLNTSHNGIKYDADTTIDVSKSGSDEKTGQGVRVSQERWEEEFFTLPYEERHNMSLDKQNLESGQIVAVKDETPNKCPYRVERTEKEDHIELLLEPCHGGAKTIRFVSRGKTGFEWKLKRDGSTYPGYKLTVVGISDEFLVEKLDAEKAYVAGAI